MAERKPARDAEIGPLEIAARAALRETAKTFSLLEKTNTTAVAAAAEILLTSLEGGGTVFFCGNGGSAADAQHMAAELAGRYFIERPSLPAVALTTNSSSLTAIGNDYGFDVVFERQLASLGAPGDVLVAITTSGGSPNVVRAVRAARRLGMSVIGLTGARGAAFAAECDVALITPSTSTPRIQEGHAAMGHALCELVERALFGEDGTPVRERLANGRRGARAGQANGARRSSRARNASGTRRSASGAAGARGGRGAASAKRPRRARAR